MLSRQNHSETKKTFEIETNSPIAELSYSLVTSNASLPGIANIVLNYAKVFTKSEIGYVSSIDPALVYVNLYLYHQWVYTPFESLKLHHAGAK